MGNIFSDSANFHWEYTESPHAARRLKILKKYPEIKGLMKSNGDRLSVFAGFIFMVLQLILAYVCFHLPFVPLALLLSVTVGSWLASGIFLQIHECCHGLTFGPNSVWSNRLYGYLLNLPLAFPVFSFFKKHHKMHHKYQGESDLDVEYASVKELKYFKGPLGKYVWMLLNPFLQIWRALTSENKEKPPDMSLEEALNMATLLLFDIWLISIGYSYMVFLLILSTIMASATNVVGFWGICLHTEFFNLEETRNYYGWQNFFMFNFGLHLEHHDFPNIPGRLLPEVRQIAPEYYDDFYTFDSLYYPIVKFILDPKYGVFSRLKHDSRRNKIIVH